MSRKSKSKTLSCVETQPAFRRGRISKLLSDSPESPLCWLLTSDLLTQEIEKRIANWYSVAAKATRKKPLGKTSANHLLDEMSATIMNVNCRSATAGIAIQCLAAAQAIAAVDSVCDPQRLWPLIEKLISHAEQLPLYPANSSLQFYIEQLQAVELPLTLTYQLPDAIVRDDMALPAAEWMASAISDVLDDDGWPRADILPWFGPLMASWARSMRLIDKLKLTLDRGAQSQLEWAVRQLFRLTRADGTLMMSGSVSAPLEPACQNLLMRISVDAEDRRLAKSFRKSGSSRLANKSKRKKQAAASSISEWGESGILQSGWHRGAPKICFDYSKKSFALEVGAETTLIAGSAFPKIVIDGLRTEPIENFEIVCEQSDADLDYIELHMALTSSITLTRQLVLSRDEDFLLIADCVVPSGPGKIEYQCSWPLAKGVGSIAETETREMYLEKGKIQSLVLPLSLPEWKVGRSTGKLEAVGNSLRLTDSIEGAGIYVPIVFDLNPDRAKKKRTWRQLTVAEDRHVIPRSHGAAFRFQLHKQQWIFYRVVGSHGNRTFMGENFNGEFVISRFDRKGAVAEMMRIE